MNYILQNLLRMIQFITLIANTIRAFSSSLKIKSTKGEKINRFLGTLQIFFSSQSLQKFFYEVLIVFIRRWSFLMR